MRLQRSLRLPEDRVAGRIVHGAVSPCGAAKRKEMRKRQVICAENPKPAPKAPQTVQAKPASAKKK